MATKRKATLAKLTRPRLYDAVPRKRLFRLLDAARKQPITWVAAPPGAGKTTLVASYLEARKVPFFWYQFDAGDADPATFFWYLVELAAQLKRPKSDRLPYLTPEYLSDIPGFARRFFRTLFSWFPSGSVLVLDNCCFSLCADNNCNLAYANSRHLPWVAKSRPPPRRADR